MNFLYYSNYRACEICNASLSVFVEHQPEDVECTFGQLTCGYILGQQWLYTTDGS